MFHIRCVGALVLTLVATDVAFAARAFDLDHPRLRQAVATWQAVTAQADGAGAWPDPVLGVAWLPAPVETRLGPQQITVGLRQRLPWPGRRERAVEVAVRRADAAWAHVQRVWLDVERDVARADHAWWRVERTHAVVREAVDLLDVLEDVVDTRYRVGDASRGELLRLEMRRAQLEDRLRSLEFQRAVAQEDLARALGRDDASSLPAPTAPVLGVLEDETLLRERLRRHPAWRAVDARRDAARAEVARERRSVWPDPTLSVDWIVVGAREDADVEDEGADAVRIGLQWPLPLSRASRGAAVDRAAAGVRETDATARDVALDLHARFVRAFHGAHDARRRVTLFDERLVPTARDALDATLIAYEQGRAGFADLVDAESTRLDLELGRIDAIVAAADATVTLRALVPAELPTEVVR